MGLRALRFSDEEKKKSTAGRRNIFTVQRTEIKENTRFYRSKKKENRDQDGIFDAFATTKCPMDTPQIQGR